MDRFEKVIKKLKAEYEPDSNVIAFLLMGSVARGEARKGSDIDVLLVIKDENKPNLHNNEIINNVPVEIGASTLKRYLEKLETNPKRIYMYLDAKAVFDRGNCLETLQKKAWELLYNWKPKLEEKESVKEAIIYFSRKIIVARKNKEMVKCAYYTSVVLEKVVEGLFLVNSMPLPGLNDALRKVNTLKMLPKNFNNLWQKVLLGDIEERTKSILKLSEFILARLDC